MVRVFSIYQFDGQTIHRIPGDIQSASLVDANHLALAKSDHVIEIVSLQRSNFDDSRTNGYSNDPANDSNIHTKYAFPTVDEVVEMIYCNVGKKQRCTPFNPFLIIFDGRIEYFVWINSICSNLIQAISSQRLSGRCQIPVLNISFVVSTQIGRIVKMQQMIRTTLA